MEKKSKKLQQGFIQGIITIMMSQVLIKVVGFVYRIYLTNKPGFGDTGNGFINVSSTIFNILLAIASVGVPTAISKLVSEKVAVKDYKEAHRVFKVALGMFMMIGIVCSLLLYFSSGFIASNIALLPKTEILIKILAPAIFFVSISAVIRGYFTGYQEMRATSISQLLEQIFNCILTILIVTMLTGSSTEEMAAGSQLASTLSILFSTAYLIIFYRFKKKIIDKNIKRTEETKPIDVKEIVKSILYISIPLSFASIISTVGKLIDNSTIISGLESIGYLKDEATRLLGMLTGRIDIIINLPLALNVAFSIALVPAIARAIKLKEYKEAHRKVGFSILITILITIPCVVALLTLAGPILGLVYNSIDSQAIILLQVSTIIILFMLITQTLSGILQGYGKIRVPAIGLFFGIIGKTIVNIIFVRIPSINIMGSVLGSIASQVISFGICYFVFVKTVKMNMSFKKYILKPIIAGVLMAIVCILGYKLLGIILPSKIAVLGTLGIASLTYGVAILKMKVVSAKEIKSIVQRG